MSDDRGSVALEWTLAMTGVVLGLALAIHVIVWWQGQQTMTDAAQTALVVARLEGGTNAAAEAEARDLIRQLGWNITGTRVEVSRSRDSVVVEVSGTARPPRPLPAFEVHARVTGPIERFEPTSRR